jgi:hypothetical protein
MMNYRQACEKARLTSLEVAHESCIVYVTATLIPGTEAEHPRIDPRGYEISDWFDGSVVAAFLNGNRRG